MFVLIFVTIGSRNYPFNRLFVELDRLVENGSITDPIFAQIGSSTYIPRNFEYTDYLDQEGFHKYINESSIVITHGASGSIMNALYEKKKIIAVTRLEKYGEHINDHQIQNNVAFGEKKLVLPVFEIEDLGSALQKIISGEDDLVEWENENPNSIIDLIENFIIKSSKE